MAENTIVATTLETPATEETATPAPTLLEQLAEHLPELREEIPVAVTPAATEAKPPVEGEPPLEPKPEAEAKPLDRDKAQERIDELTRKAKTAEENAEALRLENERLKNGGAEKKPAPAATPENDILGNVQTPEAVAKKVEISRKVLALAKGHFRHGKAVLIEDKNAEGGERELTSEEIQAMEDEAEEILRAAPERIAFLQDRAGREEEIRGLLPDYFTTGNEHAEHFERMTAAAPQLAGFADSTAATIALIIGFKEIARLRDEKAKAGGAVVTPPAAAAPKVEAKPPATAKVPLAPPAPSASTAPRVAQADAKRAAAQKAFDESDGGEESLRVYLEATAGA